MEEEGVWWWYHSDFFQRKKRNCVYTAQKHKRRYLMYIHTSFKPLQCTISICNYMRHSYSFIFENFFLLFLLFLFLTFFVDAKKSLRCRHTHKHTVWSIHGRLSSFISAAHGSGSNSCEPFPQHVVKLTFTVCVSPVHDNVFQ